MATMAGKDDRLATFRDHAAGLALKRQVADDLTLPVACDHGDQLAIFDARPVSLRRKDIGMHVMMAVDRQKATGDARRIAALGEVDHKSIRRWRAGRVLSLKRSTCLCRAGCSECSMQ